MMATIYFFFKKIKKKQQYKVYMTRNLLDCHEKILFKNIIMEINKKNYNPQQYRYSLFKKHKHSISFLKQSLLTQAFSPRTMPHPNNGLKIYYALDF